jgi:hypothetical protein
MPQVTINVNSVNYTVGYDGTFYSPQGLLNALNNLGFGIFYIATDGPINYLTTIDDNDVFGDISTSPDEILLTCNSECLGTGFDGEGSIIASAFVGGDGIFLWIAIGTSTGDAIANVNGLDRESIVGVNSYEFTNLTNGTYFVAIKDNTGNVGVSTGTTIDCTPIPNTTTTTSTTTTTTTAAATSTTTTTTTAAATSTTTTTTTSAATTTSTTTTTTTAVPIYKFSATSALVACYGGTTMTNVIITGGTTFCTATTIQADEFAALTAGDAIFISSGGKSRPATINTPNTSGIATLGVACTDCPATTTTTTSSTTTTTTQATFLASFSMVSKTDVCDVVCVNPARPVETFTVLTGGSGLCTCSTITSPLISNGTITGNFWLSDCLNNVRGFTVILESGEFVGVFVEDNCSLCRATTTSTTTTTTTAYRYSSASQLDACYSGLTMTNVVLTGGVFCSAATTIQCDEFASEIAGASIFVRLGSNSRTATINDPNVSGIATFDTNCASCPATTTTTTTTTSSSSTTTTSTTTTTTTAYRYSSASQVDACYAGLTMTNVVLTGGSFCAATTIQCDEFALEAAGISIFVSFGTSSRTATINDPNVSGIATFDTACTTCPATTTTTTTTSSTTTTTTASGTAFARSSNTFGTNILACTTGTGDGGLVYQRATLGTVPVEGAQLYNSSTTEAGTEYNPPVSGIRFMQFGASNKYAVFVATTGIMGAVFDCNATTTTTTSSTTTTTTLPCECWTVVNEDSVTINYTVTNCDGTEQSPNLLAGATRNHCIQGGSIIVVNSPIGGLLGEYECGTTCTVAADCSYCGPSTTTTTTSTSSTTSTTTPAPTTTTTTTTSSSTTTSSTTTTTTLAGIAFARSSNTFGNETLACINGTGDGGLVYQKNELGNVPVTGAQLYTSSTTGAGTEYTPGISGVRFMQFGGSTKYAVFVAANGIMGAVTSCSGVSTTTTSTTSTTSSTSSTTSSSTTTSSTTTTTTAAPTFVFNVNNGDASAFAACFSTSRDTYVWAFSGTFASGQFYYLGNSTAPTQPIQIFNGGNLYYSNDGSVITIATNGAGGDFQPCPTTTTTIPPTEYSQFLDCSGNSWYSFNIFAEDGNSSDVPGNCVFYQGATFTPAGTQFTNFFPESGCFCP